MVQTRSPRTQGAVEQLAEDPSKPLTVGVVEDSDEDFAVLARMFRRVAAGATVERWSRAEAALDRLSAARDRADTPDVLIVDLSLPGIDGCELVRRLRSQPATRDVPMFMLSGSGRPSDIERAREAGVDDYFRKSVDSAELRALVERIVIAMRR